MAVEELSNPPGQRELAYRVRDYNSSIAKMRSALSRYAIPSGPNKGSRPLSVLTTRDCDDPSIALLDSCATVIDVLTFYQERIANEGYLSTATERLSLVELTRAVGYELDPGVAAKTHLAFEVEDTPGSAECVTVPAGTQVQSLPGQDELPQVFETSERITARAAVQALRPRLTSPQRFNLNSFDVTGDQINLLVFRGAALNLVPGQLLYIPAARTTVHVRAIRVDAASELTFVDLFEGQKVNVLTGTSQPLTGSSVLVFRQQVGLLGRWSTATDSKPITHITTTTDTTTTILDVAAPATEASSQSDNKTKEPEPKTEGSKSLAQAESAEATAKPPADSNPRTLSASTTATSGAHTDVSVTNITVKIDKETAKTTTTTTTDRTTKTVSSSGESSGTAQPEPSCVYLERTVQGIVPGSTVFLVDPENPSSTAGYKVTAVEDIIESVQGTSTLCTRLTLKDYSGPGVSCTATAHVLSEPLESVELTDLVPVPHIGKLSVEDSNLRVVLAGEASPKDSNRKVVLDRDASRLQVEQQVIISGRTTTPPGASATEVQSIEMIERINGTSTLTFKNALEHTYVAGSMVISPKDWNRKVVLGRDASDLRVKQLVIISGRTTTPPGASATEVQCIENIESINGTSTLTFTKALENTYVAGSMMLALEDWNRKVVLDRDASDLRVKQLVVISGQTTTPPGASAAEVRCIEAIETKNGTSTLTFTKALENTYVASSVVLNANVALATHGQTVSREVLGSGDGAQTNQVFFLAKPDLTFVPAPNSRGSVSTLKIWVNDVLWQEVPTLFGQDGQAQCYMLRIDESGQVSVIFGDGVCGARLPTGMDNVVASYRTGLGCAGRLGANKLIIPLNRPLGIRNVYNPLPTTGGADAEPTEVARTLAPLSVRTLGRVVTLSDYQDFATSYPGVGKALVAEVAFGNEKIIHLTVIRPGGDTFEKNECEELERALLAVGDPTQVFRIDSGRAIYFGVGANLDIDPRQVAANVLAAAKQTLLDTFGFSARRFGQSVHAAQVAVTLQRVPGVQGVRLTRFALSGSEGVSPTIPIPIPVTDPPTKSTTTDTTTGAELFLISPTDVILSRGGTQ